MAQGLKLLNISYNGIEHAFTAPLPTYTGESKAFPPHTVSPLKVGPDVVDCDVMQRVKVDRASGSQATGCPC